MTKGCLTSLNNYDAVLFTILVLFIKAVHSQTPPYSGINEYSKLFCLHVHSFFKTLLAFSPTHCSTWRSVWSSALLKCYFHILFQPVPNAYHLLPPHRNCFRKQWVYKATGICRFKIQLSKTLGVSVFLTY